jgi:hypothetical protein
MPFCTEKNLQFVQKVDYNTCFQEKRHFSAENWEKSLKIAILTSIGNHPNPFGVSQTSLP